ncbi:MAG TPA: hypothetical protein VFW73_02990 [Lacipirellulaceae bacterium]|nr:hypothetical protein [Lacipirellulaceae bacterium]
MPTQFRRYELLLPTNFNDGRPVPQKVLGQTLRELRKQFGAISTETQSIEGQWEHRGRLHRDLNVRLFVDLVDNAENRQFFVEYKERLKERFQQIDIWVTTYLIDVI